MTDAPTNKDRAAWAAAAIQAFAEETGQATCGDLEHEPESVLSDLLCDLRHWCNEHKIDFDEADRVAYSAYAEEWDEEHDPLSSGP